MRAVAAAFCLLACLQVWIDYFGLVIVHSVARLALVGRIGSCEVELVFPLQVALAANRTALPGLLKGKLVKGVLVKGAKHAMQQSIGSGASLASSALSGLPVTTFETMTVPANFSRGTCEGNVCSGTLSWRQAG